MIRKFEQVKMNSNLTADELFKLVITKLPIKELHPIHKALMEECCENALANPNNITDPDTLVFAVQVAFLTCDSTLKELLSTSLKSTDASQVTLNYRNQTFIIPENSSLLRS
jgi:hypothetical protein